MSLNVDGVQKLLTEAQLNALKTVMENDDEAEKLLDLFGGEDNDIAGFKDEAMDVLGLSEDMINSIAEVDDVFKGLLDGSLTIEELEETAKPVDGDTTAAAADGTKEGGKTKTREELKALEEEAANLQKEIEKLDADIEAQKAKIEEKKKELEEKKAELEEKQAALDAANEKLAAEQAKLNEISDNIKAKEKEKKEVEELIQTKQDELMAKAEETQAEAVRKAKSSYDAERDSDFNTYLMNKLDSLNVDPALVSEINQLTNRLTGINTSLSTLNGQFAAQQTIVEAANKEVVAAQGEVDTVNNAIAGINSEITNAESAIKENTALKAEKQTEYDAKVAEIEKAAASIKVKDPAATSGIGTEANDSVKTQDEVVNMVPEAERALIDKYDIDLGEKLDDGSPRYIFAQGADNNYHVYDMGTGGKNGATLARLYEPGNGFDIVPSGSGYLNGFQEAGPNSGRTVYYFCGDNVKEMQGCYSTSSPLSFDLNGDGVKTSDKVVEFDIDGDGVVDKINDSADAVLVFDKDGDGISGEDGSECFGDNTDIDGDGVKDGYKDGFEALKAFARDKGLINDADDMVLDSNDIKYLEENFGFGLKTEGYNSEAKSLTDLGITEINLAKTDKTSLEDDFDGNGNQLMTQDGATFVQNGETKEYADIWHRKLDEGEESVKDTAKETTQASNTKNAFNTYNAYDDFLANFDPSAYTSVFSAKVDTTFNFLDVNADAPSEDKDKQEKKKVDENGAAQN